VGIEVEAVSFVAASEDLDMNTLIFAVEYAVNRRNHPRFLIILSVRDLSLTLERKTIMKTMITRRSVLLDLPSLSGSS